MKNCFSFGSSFFKIKIGDIFEFLSKYGQRFMILENWGIWIIYCWIYGLPKLQLYFIDGRLDQLKKRYTRITANSIRIWKIQRWCSLSSFSVNLDQKFKIISLCWNLVPRLIWIYRIQWCCSLFLFSTAKTFLGKIWAQNSKLPLQTEV